MASLRLYQKFGFRNPASELKEDREGAYQTALRAAEIRLLAETKLGKLLSKIELKRVKRGADTHFNGNIGKLKDLGLTWNDSSRLQKVAEHKALIPEAVERAKETSDIPKNKLERIIRSSLRQPRSSALLNLAKSASLAKS